MLGILLALGSALTWGCGDFLSGLMSRRLPLLAVLLFTQAIGIPLMGVLALGRGVPADWTFIPLAIAAVLSSLFPVITVALARIFLQERLSLSQGAGVLSALAGVALIAWR